jgi:hypothetical protein
MIPSAGVGGPYTDRCNLVTIEGMGLLLSIRDLRSFSSSGVHRLLVFFGTAVIFSSPSAQLFSARLAAPAGITFGEFFIIGTDPNLRYRHTTSPATIAQPSTNASVALG